MRLRGFNQSKGNCIEGEIGVDENETRIWFAPIVLLGSSWGSGGGEERGWGINTPCAGDWGWEQGGK